MAITANATAAGPRRLGQFPARGAHAQPDVVVRAGPNAVEAQRAVHVGGDGGHEQFGLAAGEVTLTVGVDDLRGSAERGRRVGHGQLRGVTAVQAWLVLAGPADVRVDGHY